MDQQIPQQPETGMPPVPPQTDGTPTAPAQPVQSIPANDAAPVQPVQSIPVNDAPPAQPVQSIPVNDAPPAQPVQSVPANDTPPVQPVQNIPVNDAPPAQPPFPWQRPVPQYAPSYAAPPMPEPPRKRRNHAPLAVVLLCLGLSAVLALSSVLVHIAGTPRRHKRPEPGEVPGFSIEERPEDLDGGLSTEEIARAVGPSVVCINVYDPRSIAVAGSGSGIILNKEGFIVTNAHVVEGSSAVTVQLQNGEEYDAWIVGSDVRTDLAVIKITAENLHPAQFGNSDTLHVGERAIAIGNAAGEFAGTVTQGIISGLDREITLPSPDGAVKMTLIQTDASINPGNSGGALVNRHGQVIGINSSKMNSTTYEGIGFAIPSADAQPVVEDLIAYGYVKDRVALGVMVIALTPATGPVNDLPADGLYISDIMDYSDLLNHGIAVGDVILRADGIPIHVPDDLLDVLETHKPEETVKLEILKTKTGEIVQIDAVLSEKRS